MKETKDFDECISIVKFTKSFKFISSILTDNLIEIKQNLDKYFKN